MPLDITIKMTLPKYGVFRNKKWLDKIRSEMKQNSVRELKGLFEKTVFGWSAEKKPRFAYDMIVTQDYVGLSMYPTGNGSDIWDLVSSGSPPHRIPARPGGLLKFRPGYRAATIPGSIMSRRAYRSGPLLSATQIQPHPGFEARKFPEQIEIEFYHTFVDQMQRAVNEAARGK